MRYLPFVIQFALLVYCLVECIQSDRDRIRNLPKGAWVLLIVVLPVAGGIAWLVAGRPLGPAPRRVAWPSTATAGFPEYERPSRTAPDDDPEFLAGLRDSDRKHEQMLRDWEADLRDRDLRDRELRDRDRRADDGAAEPS